MLRVYDIIPSTTVDGLGWRTSVYVSGCYHRCHNCHNTRTWPLSAGAETSIDSIISVLEETGHDLTLTGGDPLYQVAECAKLAARARDELHRNVWCYTGFLYEFILKHAEVSKGFNALLHSIDVLVDGPFVESMKNKDLLFRGSSNQRIIDVPRSISEGRVVELNIDVSPHF